MRTSAWAREALLASASDERLTPQEYHRSPAAPSYYTAQPARRAPSESSGKPPLKPQSYRGIQPALRPPRNYCENAELAHEADPAFFVPWASLGPPVPHLRLGRRPV